MPLITFDQTFSGHSRSYTVPSGKTWSPVSIGIRWDAGSVNGLRQVGLRLLGPDDRFWNCKISNVLQPAQSTRFYSFSPNQEDEGSPQNNLIEIGLPGWRIPAGYKLWLGDYRRISSGDNLKVRMIIDEV